MENLSELHLRPMTESEFTEFRSRLVEVFGQDGIRAGWWSADVASVEAASEIDKQVTDGLATPGMLFLIAETEERELVGHVALMLRRPMGPPDTAFLYDIEVRAEHRGHGYGRSLLKAAEDVLRGQGATSVRLNVFGYDEAARHIYETSGYQITAQEMIKNLS